MSRFRTAEERADANRAALDTYYRQGPEPEPEMKDVSSGTLRLRCCVDGCHRLTYGDFCVRHDSMTAMYGDE